MTAATFTIPTSRLPDAQSLITRWTKRAAKLHLAAPTLAVVRTFTHYWLVDSKGSPVGDVRETCPVVPADHPRWSVRSLDMVEIEVTGERPKLAGWQFVAAIEHRDGGNILRHVPGHSVDLPRSYRTAPPDCDHCNTARNRAETFVVQKLLDDGTPTSELIQVGRSCLRDFIGGTDPAAWLDALAFARAISTLMEWDPDGLGGFGFSGRAVPVVRFLECVAAEVRRGGYVSASRARESIRPLTPTGLAAYHGLTDKREDVRASWADAVQPCDRATVEAALAWLRGDDSGDSDYIHNLRTYAGDEIVTHSSANTLASLIPSYRRHVGLVAEYDVKSNEHLPGVAAGDKIKDRVATLVGEHAYDTGFGRQWLLRFEDQAGRCIIWRTSKSTGLDLGTQVLIAGTVKALGEYGGTQQTELTRCKIAARVCESSGVDGCEGTKPKRRAGACVKKGDAKGSEAEGAETAPLAVRCTVACDDADPFDVFDAA